MKKVLSLSILSLCLCTFLQAQKIKVSESSGKFENGSHNALMVTIYEASEKDVEKEWKSLMKDYKAKVSTKNEIFADNALIKSISENTMDVYAKMEAKDGTITFYVAVDMGGAYMNSKEHATEYKVMEKIVYDFAVKTTKEAIAGMLKNEEKIYSRLEGEQEDLVKSKERLGKDIENYKAEIERLKKSIAQAEKDIEQNLKDQEKKKEEMAKQKKVVDAVAEKQKAVN